MRPIDWHAMWVPSCPPYEVALRAAIIYAVVQTLFRLVGRRQFAKYSSFDIVVLFLVTVAVRKSIVGDDGSLTTAIVALATIVGLDVMLTALSKRSRLVSHFVQGRLLELVRNGEVLDQGLRTAHMSRDDLMAELRAHGRESLDGVAHAYQEHSGRVSFVWQDAPQKSTES